MPTSRLTVGVEQLDLQIADDRGELGIVHGQPREPQPARADLAEQGAVLFGSSGRTGHSASGDSGQGLGRRRLAHFEVGDDRGELAVGDGRQAHAQLASGGRLIRIASMLPPVLSPNKVPRS